MKWFLLVKKKCASISQCAVIFICFYFCVKMSEVRLFLTLPRYYCGINKWKFLQICEQILFKVIMSLNFIWSYIYLFWSTFWSLFLDRPECRYWFLGAQATRAPLSLWFFEGGGGGEISFLSSKRLFEYKIVFAYELFGTFESFGIFWNLLKSFGIFWNLLESVRIC